MKTIKKQVIYLLLIGFVFTGACKKEDPATPKNNTSNTGQDTTNNNQPVEKQCFLTITKYPTNSYFNRTENLYNSDMNLIKITSFDSSGKLSGYMVYEYSNGLLTKGTNYSANGTTDTYVTYEYKGNNLVSIRSFNIISGSYKEINRNEYEYGANGKVLKQTSYTVDGSFNLKLNGFSNWAWDENGNVISIKNYFNNNYNGETQYTFDDKKNFRKNMPGVSPIYISKNNPKSWKIIDSQGKTTNEYLFSYQYNSDNYPLSMSQNFQGATSTNTYEYTCK
jgi:hypothetical protein